MSIVGKILVPQAKLEIFDTQLRTAIDLKGWVANQGYFIDEDIEPSEFELRPSDLSSLFPAYANDCNRMAIAAIESAAGLRLETTLSDSGAWGVIRAYYAAFFAIHSILRMYGVSCTQIEQVHADKVYEIAQLVGKDGGHSKIKNGFYSIEITGAPTVVKFTHYKDSHAGTWRRFLELVDSLISKSRDATALSQDKSDTIDLLCRIRSGITKASRYSSGNWLSILRNTVNYQHTHGVWFPYEQRAVAQACIPHMAKAWKQQTCDLSCRFGNGEIEYFFEIVLLIMSFFRELLIGCHKKSGSKNPIFVNGAIRLLNTLQMV